MYQQKTLFDLEPPAATPPAPHVRGSETSKAAAETIQPHAGRLRELVCRFLADRGEQGATDEELCEALNLQSDTGRARRCGLRDTGHVTDSGRRRPTRSGRKATVWVATGKPLSADGDG